jgi:hypothetical protein
VKILSAQEYEIPSVNDKEGNQMAGLSNEVESEQGSIPPFIFLSDVLMR